MPILKAPGEVNWGVCPDNLIFNYKQMNAIIARIIVQNSSYGSKNALIACINGSSNLRNITRFVEYGCHQYMIISTFFALGENTHLVFWHLRRVAWPILSKGK